MKNCKRARDFCLVCRAADEPPDLSLAAELAACLDASLAIELIEHEEQAGS
jgi:hypothetical protein